MVVCLIAAVGTYILTASHADTAYGWSNWESLGGSLTSAPAVSSWAPGRLDVFTRGTDAQLYHKWYDSAGWHNWELLGGLVVNSDPAAVSWGNGRIDVFATGTDNALYHKWYDSAGWHNWESLGGQLTSGPAVASWGNGRLDVFGRGTDNALYHKWYTTTGGWSGWQSLGGGLTSSPAAVSWGNGRLDVFVRGTDNALYHKWYDSNGWSAWEDRGGVLTSAPAVSSWGSGRLDVFVAGTDNALDHMWYSSSGWSGWEGLGGVLTSSPAAVSWGSGRIDVFVRGTDNALYHKWYPAPLPPPEPSLGAQLPIGQSIPAGSALYSPSNTYRALMQTDGNFVIYKNSTEMPMWSTGTTGSGANVLNFQSDGNLVVRPAGGAAAWASGTNTYGGVTLNMQDDGNLVEYNAAGVAVWSSLTGKISPPPTATLTAPATLPVGAAAQLSIASTVASSCKINGSAVTTNGTVTEPAISDDTSYTLQCTGPGGSAASSKTIVSTPRLVASLLPDSDPLSGVNVSNSTGSIASANVTLTQPNRYNNGLMGYAIAGQSGTYTQAEGTITVPHASCPAVSESHTAIWVGLDGVDGTNTVEQDGLLIDCWGHHPPVYQAYTQMYPNDLVRHPILVLPGDTLLMRVSYNPANSTFTLYIHDLTSGNGTGSSVSVAAKCPSGYNCQRKTAAWIVERPQYKINGVFNYLPLTNFSSVTFSNAVASTQSDYTSYAFTDWKNFPINVVGPNGPLVSLPIPLYEQTRLFTIGQLRIQ
jgi:hypothetical protein